MTIAAPPSPSPTAPARPLRRAAKLRVAFFSDAIYGRNGVGFYYKDLVEHLNDRVERAELFCPGAPTAGAPLVAASMPMPGDKTQRLYWPYRALLEQRFRALRPHIAVVATPAPFGYYGIRLAKRFGVPVCAAFHTDFESLADIYWNRFTAAPSMKFLEIAHRLLFRPGGIVATMSENMIEQARRCGARDVRIVGTTIEKRFLDAPLAPLGDRLESVLFAGRLAAEKNITAILQAAAALPDIRFVLAGDGPLRSDVENAARRHPNIDYRGWVAHDDLLGLMDESQMLLLPSHVESFGTVALEAMARRRLALVSENCGILDWPGLGDELHVVHRDEPLADAIRRAADAPPDARQARAEASRSAVRGFVDRTLAQWLEIFRDTLRNHRSSTRS